MATKGKGASAVQSIKVIADKDFAPLLKQISGKSNDLALDIHTAGLFCIQQANLHNNAGFAQQLIEAIGDKQDIRRVARWMQFYGKIAVKNNLLVFKKRKDITPANAEGWLKKANEIPYWVHTPQPQLEVTYDYLAMINSIVNKAINKGKLEEEGKTVTEKNVDVLDALNKILIAHAPAEEKQTVKAKAQSIADRVKTFEEPASAH